MFEDKSRYKGLETYLVPDRNGRQVLVVEIPPRLDVESTGIHRRKQGQKLDHLAYHYLGDASAYWRIAEVNQAMNADQLDEVMAIDIPPRKRG